MHRYGVREVEKLLRLGRSTIRALIGAGFVSPERGPRNAWRFSFQDLVVLRTAQALAEAQVPPRRIVRSMKALRSRLPEEMPLSGLSVRVVADRVVVREGSGHWQAESGQYLLAFEGDPADGSMSVIEHKAAASQAGSAPTHAPAHAAHWFEQALALERDEPESARRAYERAIVEAPKLLDARINLGSLLHEAGRLTEAERVYRDAIAACGADPTLMYNLGVLLDDMDRKHEAMDAYQTALRGDPGLADCHYNLALLCEQFRQPREAIRHMAQYRRLVKTE
ncbi:tetratricopeptide repeat protein [Aromatoleum toluvorans]|uniref:Tetratricopeptide repeat protein n=1 Tax=Aromatoleum toluvorans TaxID=92002 RepID=A0ABX1PVC4_9RHOO|nr:tetratricopeptide repeat protein [Aromatoleum toluvorans]NMG43384.1 tetratricopeptide repeat protein [Aromatoleum toluvorans]